MHKTGLSEKREHAASLMKSRIKRSLNLWGSDDMQMQKTAHWYGGYYRNSIEKMQSRSHDWRELAEKNVFTKRLKKGRLMFGKCKFYDREEWKERKKLARKEGAEQVKQGIVEYDERYDD